MFKSEECVYVCALVYIFQINTCIYVHAHRLIHNPICYDERNLERNLENIEIKKGTVAINLK